MFASIQNLREQSEKKKRKVSMSIALTVTALILVIWVTTLPVRFGSSGGEQEANARQSEVADQTRSAFTDVFLMAERAIAPLRELGDTMPQ